MQFEKLFPCPVCGHLVHKRMPGNHKLCPICGWEDDLVQLRFPLMECSANAVSLQRAQNNYAQIGVAEKRKLGSTRAPNELDTKDEGWRPLDAKIDNIEEPHRGEDYSLTYPWEDTTVLYYWRESYWRRFNA